MRASSEGRPPSRSSDQPRTSAVGIAIRIPVAVTLFAFGGYLAYDRVVRTVGIDGTLTSTLYPVTAPIDGIVRHGALSIGAPVTNGERLFTLENAVADTSALDRLEAELDALGTEARAAGARIVALEATEITLTKRLAAHRSVSVERLAISIEEARAALEAARAHHALALAERERVEGVSGDFVTGTRRDAAAAGTAVAAAEIERHAAILARLQAEFDAASRGIFVSDGYYETPYSQQRLDEVRLRLIDERAGLDRAHALIEARRERLTSERQRAAKLRDRDVGSPAAGVVWTSHVRPGSHVRAGQPMAMLADCDDLFVEVSLSERRIDRVSLGQRVSVEFVGDAAPVPGRVTSIQGAGAREGDRGRAAAVERGEAGMMTVAVAVERRDLERAIGRDCQIGRSAEVRFDAGPDLGIGGMERVVEGLRRRLAHLSASAEAAMAMLGAGRRDGGAEVRVEAGESGLHAAHRLAGTR